MACGGGRRCGAVVENVVGCGVCVRGRQSSVLGKADEPCAALLVKLVCDASALLRRVCHERHAELENTHVLFEAIPISL